MSSAGWELQKAVAGALAAHPGLTALLGGAKIYNDVPRGAALPYVTLGETSVRDWSTGTEDGHEHILTITAWSRANGEREVQQIVDEVRHLLHEAALTLPGFHLVNLRAEFSEVGRDADGETSRGLVRLRAVTEPAA